MAVPKKDSLLAAFSENFNARITAAGSPYPVSAEQLEAYTTAHTRFIDAYAALLGMRAQGTWVESQTILKDDTKRQLQRIARSLYQMLKSNRAISDADKRLAGIHLSDTPRRIPRPSARPGLHIDSVIGRTVHLSLYDSENDARRGKPPSTVAAWVYTFVGTDFPSRSSAWRFAGACTKPKHEITFPSDLPAGAKVWICAAWINRKQQAGPRSFALGTNLQGGGSERDEALRMAA